jgi:mRNA-decapping enzyme subunit 2
MTYTNSSLVDCLDDLCVRFIVNLPNEELQSVERICFQIEEAQWFYEDFIRPQNPNNLPSMHLRKFSQLMFQHCPLFSAYSEELHQQAYEQFLAYKTRVPVRGAIMLNEEMTHAVLVKGWKKGAKWSFPRGKINKEEDDLDCAVREVWEETGYDLRKAELVEPEEHMKKITVTMREQSMMLYVFRGVPMDTYFEPQTRKEISKIDWYRLTDLPTLRRKNQVQQQQQQQQQGAGQDLIKENMFYMVAPFLGPLKQWIKQQNKLGRQRARNSAYVAPPPVAETDDEDIQPELYETPADEPAPVTTAQPTDSFAEMVARLGRGQPTADLPELSAQTQQQTPDPAEALKRLLSVGMGMQSRPVEAPSYPNTNPLLALFHQGKTQPGGPRTPFEQIMPSPVQPSSPHGQHQPRPPQMGNMGPPPPFFPPNQNLPFRGSPGHFNGVPPPQMPPQFMQQSPRGPMFQPPNMQQAFDQRNPRPFQEMGDSQFAAGNGRPTVPPASNLPAPNLNAHTLGLLNSFRPTYQQSAPVQSPQNIVATPLQQNVQTTPKIQHPLPQHRMHGLVSPPQAHFIASSPQFQSPPITTGFVPEQPKPKNAHHDSLLSLFRPTPPLASPEPPPAELSALPTTPAYMSAQPAAKPSRLPNPALLGAYGLPTKMDMTSATVSGPVNAPDFETMKKNKAQPVSARSSRGPSPAMQTPFMPQQILKRGQPSPAPQGIAKVSGPTHTVITSHRAQPRPAPTAKIPSPAFKPQILKRPQQVEQLAQTLPKPTPHTQGLLDMFKGPSPQPVTRSPAPPPDHKNVLLSLFGSKPSPSPNPETSMSGVISPVSPLPMGAASPEGVANRSRISSMGDGTVPGLVIPPTPTSHSHPSEGGVGLGRTGSASGGKSPVDKNFLLGFLADVAARGR